VTEDELHRQQQINSAIVHTGLRFGVALAATEAILLAIGSLFGINPYAPLGILGLLLLPVFAGLGLRYLRRFEATNHLSFGQTFRVGSTITFIGALCSALLIYIFTALAGEDLLMQYLAEVKQMMDANQGQLNEWMGKATTNRVMEQLNKITPGVLAYEDFVRKVMVGMLTSLVMAFFFRK
jgi:hypothetical protein